MNTVSGKLSRCCEPVLKTAGCAISPKWFPAVIIIVLIYIPFFSKYGWGYRNIPNTDLPSFWSASVQVFTNHKSPYDRKTLQQVMKQDIHVHPYLYPPPSLLFFYPLSIMDYTTARHVVLIGNHLIICALLFVILVFPLSSSKPRSPLPFVLTCVCLLTFHPTVLTLNHGQMNFLLLALILAFWILAKKKYAFTASLFLTAAILLKTYPLIILPMLLVTGRRRECLYTTFLLGLMTAISLLVLPCEIWKEWILNVLPNGGYMRTPPGLFPPSAIWNQSLNGFFARMFTENPWSVPILIDESLARWMTYGFAALIAVISHMAVYRGSMIDSVGIDRTMIVTLPAMYLVAPFSWEHHLVYLFPSIIAILISRSFLPATPTILFHSAAISAALLIGIEQGLRFRFYGVVILWILCIFTACSKEIQMPDNTCESNN